MLPTRQGSFRLFRLFGIDVYLHWSWFLVLAYFLSTAQAEHTSWTWVTLECLALFSVVLTHEFGHALACRQVGGRADLIVLWPFGGVAYVSPPQRPGPVLWSIAAGPLVNVILAPILGLLVYLGGSWGWEQSMPNAYGLFQTIFVINLWLLYFNLLPIYPLDGGQILQALLWFVLGRARSLMVATVIGFIGVAGLIAFAIMKWQPLLGGICVLIVLNCWQGLMYARMLTRMAKMPHRPGFACPSCQQPPIIGAIWRCDRCFKPFDIFETRAVCPHCRSHFAVARCPECGEVHPFEQWAHPGASNVPPVL